MIDKFEIIGLIAAFLTTSAFVPQVYKAWKSKSTESLSLSMYVVFFIGIMLWLVYGFYLNSLAMILSNIVTGFLALILIFLPNNNFKELIKLKELDMMKKTAFLINTSRGSIINEDDLIIALSTNVIAGAGLDVYEKEPLPEGNKLRFLPNALLMPHVGYVTAENYSVFYTQMIEGLEACVNDKPIRIIEK